MKPRTTIEIVKDPPAYGPRTKVLGSPTGCYTCSGSQGVRFVVLGWSGWSDPSAHPDDNHKTAIGLCSFCRDDLESALATSDGRTYVE